MVKYLRESSQSILNFGNKQNVGRSLGSYVPESENLPNKAEGWNISRRAKSDGRTKYCNHKGRSASLD